MSDYEIYHDQLQTDYRRAQNDENSSRAATFVSTHLSVGDGEFLSPEPTMFDCTFIGKPIVSHGAELVQRPDKTIFQLPRPFAGVYQWLFNETSSGLTLYTGAYLFFTVDVAYLPNVTSTAAPASRVLHNVTFAGIGMKQFPQDIYEMAGLQ